MRVRVMAQGLAATWVLATLLPGLALARDANSKENNTKAAAVGLTAASAVLLTKKNTRKTGVVAGAGAAYAWKKHHDYVKQRHKDTARERSQARPSFRTSKTAASKKYVKSGPKGRAVGYYTRSAHSGTKAVSKGKPSSNAKATKKIVKEIVKSNR